MTRSPHDRAADQSLFKIEAAVRDLKSQMLAAGKAHDKAEDAMGAWHKRNPEPLMWKAHLGRYQDANAPAAAEMANERARTQYEKAHARWKRREQKALKACRLKEREVAWVASIARLDAQCKRAAGIRATSLEGLRCKARLVEAEDPVGLAFSIVNDLVALSRRAAV